YTASKIYPYILARKPMLAVFHERSSVCDVVRDTGAGAVVPFKTGQPPEMHADALFKTWDGMLSRLPFVPATDWAAFEVFGARQMARSQCELFDQVVCCRQK